MDDVILAAIRAHAAQEAPRECCGLIVVERGRERYRACRNVSAGPSEFEIKAEDWADAEDAGAIVAVVHSHPFRGPDPSQADLVGCERSGVPWLIVNHPIGHWKEIRPSGYRAPLVGRTFTHGVLDCYSLIRDYYRETLRIDLPDFPRREQWWKDGGDLYRDNFARAGFAPATGLLEHDVILMQIASPVPNHAGVYLGRQVILQHLEGRLSSRDIYGGWFQKVTTNVIRHRDVK